MTEPRTAGRCAIYTRKSSEEGLDQSFNSLHAQREACEAYVLSQKHEGWQALTATYDDGGFSGGNMERPGLKKLLADISAGLIDTVVVYKVDRLTRSLSDFARIVESFDSKGVSFVSVTQQFNTTSSMGRLTLNVLLSFAQFEREVTGERIRDKIAASKKKGLWMGGTVPLGFDVVDRQLVVNEREAETVRMIFKRYLELKSVADLQEELESLGVRSKARPHWKSPTGGEIMSRGTIYHLLANPLYIGRTHHKGALYEGKHEAIIDETTWDKAAVLLKANGVLRRNRKNIPSGRMLHGKLMTERGRFYTPTHSSKGGRRYFYYTLAGKGIEESEREILRLPAAEVESRVISAITSILSDSLQLAKEFCSLNVRDMKLLTSAAHHQSTLLMEDSARNTGQFIAQVLSRIVVLPSGLRIELDRKWLAKELAGLNWYSAAASPITIELPYVLARRGNEVRLILTDGTHQKRLPTPTLVRAIAQAKSWYQWVVDGEIRTMRELAKRTGLNENYVSRIFQLIVLSSENTRALLEGEHSRLLTVALLTQRVEMKWELQRLPA